MVYLTQKEEIARSRLCLPLDVDSTQQAIGLVRELYEHVGLFKVGKELFTNAMREGVNVVKLIQQEGSNVFLDLKYHDIPKTVKGAAKAASSLDVYMFNVHASGGYEMLEAAVAGAEEGAKIYGVKMPKVVAVTVLTSIDDKVMNEQLMVPGKVPDQVLHLAKLAESAGLNGIVCSPADLYAVKDKLHPKFMYVTPGIQAVGGVVGADQKRVFTPGNAIEDGSTILVAGRTITMIKDKGTGLDRKATPDEMRANAHGILKDMAQHL